MTVNDGRYGIVVHRDTDGAFWSEVPDLPGCVSHGNDLNETVANTAEAIEMWVAYLRDKGKIDVTDNGNVGS